MPDGQSGAPLTVSIIGSGAWGAAFGRAIASADCAVIFQDRDPARAEAAAEAAGGRAASLAEAAAADIIIIAVSSAAFADALRQLAAAAAPLLWLTKGIDPASGRPLHQVAAERLPGRAYGVISGPSFAEEVARGLPAALSIAVSPEADGARLRAALHRPHLRLYPEDDIAGVCIGGAVKNIIAIAAGISDGLQMGENARAALITRGLAEMTALACALGGRRETLLGLCGAGDLTLTCCSDLSRNRRLGLKIAASERLPASDDATCEGAAAAAAVAALAGAHRLELPIISAVADVLAGELPPAAAARRLIARPPH